MPDGVAMQELLLAGVGAFGDGPGDPVFQPRQLLIAWRQRPGGDQDRAQVPDGLGVGQVVECGVGERPLACAKLTQDRGCRALVKPAHYRGGALVAGQVLIESLQFGPDLAAVVAEHVTQPLLQAAARAPAGVKLRGLTATRAAAPERGVGARACGAQGLVQGAAADPAG